MKKLLLIAVVVAGTSALVLAGRGEGFGRQGFANGPGWMHSGPGGGFGRQGFANGPGSMRSGPGGGFGRQGFANGPGQMNIGHGGGRNFGPMGSLKDTGSPAMRLGALDLTDEQKDVIAQLVEDSRAKLHADIEAVLTPEQVEKLQQLRDDGAARGFAGLDLTDEQQTAIAGIRENARAEAQTAETHEARRQIMQAAHEEVLSVLTDEQIETLEQPSPRMPWGRGGPGRGQIGTGSRGPYAGPDGPLAALDLTEDQKASIEAIREQARTDAEAAETREARREIMQTAHEEVLSVLTDEQIETLEQSSPRKPRGWGGPGRGRW